MLSEENCIVSRRLWDNVVQDPAQFDRVALVTMLYGHGGLIIVALVTS